MDRDDWLDIAPVPVSEIEEERLGKLKHYENINAGPEQENWFNRLAKSAAEIFDLLIGSFNLPTHNMECKKVHYGFDSQSTPKNVSLCQFTIAPKDIVEIEDARESSQLICEPNEKRPVVRALNTWIPLKSSGYQGRNARHSSWLMISIRNLKLISVSNILSNPIQNILNYKQTSNQLLQLREEGPAFTFRCQTDKEITNG